MAFELNLGTIHTLKVPSTPSDPSQAVLDGVQAFLHMVPAVKASDIHFFAHGTTVATNAIIERKGVCTGLFITKGTGAVYLARMSRQPPATQMLNPYYSKPTPLVPRRLTREIPERVLYDGTIEKPLDETTVLDSVAELVRLYDVKSIAICYLFSFMNDFHERRTCEIIERNFPDVRVSRSSAIIPIVREYRRLSTTVLDAYIGPMLANYIKRLGDGLKDLGVTSKQVFIMQSNGGLMSIGVARSNPVHTLLSGPAAGVISGAYLSKLTGFRNVVTFDVGGTSTDIATIIDGVVTEADEGVIGGHDVAVPMNEIGTIGAGGGTIARVGSDGRLKVGPDSAGARPGPACYGLGGDEPTVTDADLVLGYLNPNYFLGGRLAIDKHLAFKAIETKVADKLGISVETAASGIVKIINSSMEGELRLRLMARGFDPRAFALVALGGAGPVHACMVAKNLGIRDVVVPPYPGLGSAMGLLLTDIKHDYIQSHLKLFADFSGHEMEREFETLLGRGRAEAEAEGSDLSNLLCECFLDLRYVGQGYELTVPCPPQPISVAVKNKVAAQFHELHKTIYGHNAPNDRLEVVNFRLITKIPQRKLVLGQQMKQAGGKITDAVKGSRKAFFEEAGGYVDTPVYDRSLLYSGAEIRGPVLLEQSDSTTVVVPGQVVRVDVYSNLIVSLEG
jgi:N-methylhydantoinase A